MSSVEESLDRGRTQLLTNEARRRLGEVVVSLEAHPRRVLAVLVAAQWSAVLAFALTVRHAGWIFYQGGDQLWYYTTGWLFAHGHLGEAGVGYLWSSLLAPISLGAGPNAVHAMPAILLIDVLVLSPIALLALYGIAQRIAGRLFGYWAVVVWIGLPFLGIAYTNVGYHQRYTELFLPQALGLTAMADYPSLVAVLVAGYFCAKVIFDERPQLLDAVAGGLAAGAAFAIKPSAALFLVGPALSFLASRRVRLAAVFALGVVPALVTLTVWKWRGIGTLPFSSSHGATRIALGTFGVPLGLGLLPHSLNLDWNHFQQQLDALQEYFWSSRVVEWVSFAGVIALGRRSLRAALLVGGWYGSFVVVKGTYVQASFADAGLLRIMIVAAPAFVLIVAAVPLLFPGLPRRLAARDTPPQNPPSLRVRLTLIVAAVLVTSVIPLVAIAAEPRQSGLIAVTLNNGTPVPNDIGIGLSVQTAPDGRVDISWKRQAGGGSPVFYRVYRGPAAASDYSCPVVYVVPRCLLQLTAIGETSATHFVDKPGAGRWRYRIGVAANWLNDPSYGDVYEMSSGISVSVSR